MYTEDLSEVKRESIADAIIEYFKRDILGQTSNLHLALAINEGLQNEDTQVAAFLASIQVDYAKHGRCIKLDKIEELKKARNKKGIPKFLAEDKDYDES